MIAVARIAKSVGTRGEVKIHLLTDDGQRFKKLETAWIGREANEVHEFEIAGVRFNRDQPILKFRGIDSRNAADALQGSYVFVTPECAVKPRPGSYLIHDLIDMEVFTEEGVQVGVVKDVWRLPANDVLVVQDGEKEVLVPFIKKIMKRVDMKRNVIVIDAIEGMFE